MLLKGSQFWFMIFQLICAILELCDMTCSHSNIYMTCMAIASFCLIYFCLFYFQYFPYCSMIIFLINNLMMTTFVFLFISFFIYLAFASMFLLMHAPVPCALSNASLSINETIHNLNLGSEIYKTLLLAFSIVPPDPLEFENSHFPFLTQFFYLILIVINAILLINLLIALYNDNVGLFQQYKSTLMSLQRLNFMTNIGAYIESAPILFKPVTFLKGKLCKLKSNESGYEEIYTIEKVITRQTQN